MALKEILIDISDSIPQSEKKKKIWDYGYNEKYDVVVISKTKTIGQVFNIDGLKIAIPPPPPKTKIANCNKQKIDQRWERKMLPDELAEVEEEAANQNKKIKEPLTAEEIFYNRGDAFIAKYNPYINEEFRRRADGHWFMNNGVPTYITGGHYMMVQWSKLEHLYWADYRFPQRVIYYHWEACVADYRSHGQCYLKNRRSGFTTVESCDAVDYGTQTKSALIGIMSKTSDDAKTMFTDVIVPIFKYYPFFFKPIQSGQTNPVSELPFREISKKITSRNRATSKSSKGLNTVIRHTSTAINGFDSKKVNRLKLDEIGKWPPECRIDDYLPVGMETLVKGARLIGKAQIGSTANAPDKGGKEFKLVFNNSKEETRDPVTKMTITKLNALFIPAEYNLSGFFDIYGNCILHDDPKGIKTDIETTTTIGSITYLEARRKQLKNDPKLYNAELRKHPTTEDHAFLVPSDSCLFNVDNIEQQKEYNGSKFDLKTKKSLLYRRGDLSWVEYGKVVEWVENPRNGKFLTSYLPGKELANNKTYIHDKQAPGNTQYFVGGVDSYDITATVDGRGSKGALHIFAKNAFQYAPNQFVLEYCERPQTVEIYIDDVIKALVFYGCEALIENNKPRLLSDMKKFGFRKYSMNRPDKKFHKLSHTERDVGGIPSSGGTIPSHAEFLERYIVQYCGVNLDDKSDRYGEMGNVYFDELLNDWLTFDIHDREKFDRTVSSGFALWGANKIMSSRDPSKRRIYKYF